MLIMSTTKVFSDVIREWSEVFMHHSGRDFRRFMMDSSLSFSQVTVLMRLYHGGKGGVSEIGGEMGITNAAASQAVDRLVNLGLIGRSEDPADRRAKQLVLTEKGHDLVDRAIEARSRWVEGLAVSLDPDQQDLVMSALTLLTDMARHMDG
jgi:DNA-binding MarR family transcriptional regulator